VLRGILDRGMLEIAMLIALTRKLLAMTTERGTHGAWSALGPVLWISGEVSGFFVGGMFGLEDLACYPVAIFFGVIGAALSWAIVREAPISLVLPSDETEEALSGRGGRS
jgi:hypothetical protein